MPGAKIELSAALPAFIEVGSGNEQRRIAVRARARRRARAVLARRLPFRHDRHQGGGGRRLGRRTRPRLRPVRLFRPRRIRRRFRRRHHRPLAGGERWRCSTRICEGPQVVIGSSMGGWMALLLARELRRIAAARSRPPRRPGADRAGAGLHRSADVERVFAGDPRADRDRRASGCGRRTMASPIRSPSALIEDGRNHLLLGGAIELGCPVRILQGQQDPDVPWRHAFALTDRLPCDDVVLTMIQDGDHRLVASAGHRPADRGGEGVRLSEPLIVRVQRRCDAVRRHRPRKRSPCPGCRNRIVRHAVLRPCGG